MGSVPTETEGVRVLTLGRVGKMVGWRYMVLRWLLFGRRYFIKTFLEMVERKRTKCMVLECIKP